jgi:hypothetical protein
MRRPSADPIEDSDTYLLRLTIAQTISNDTDEAIRDVWAGALERFSEHVD